MLRWRVRNDCAPRTKNGQPPQSTTGVASANWTKREVWCQQWCKSEMAAHLQAPRRAARGSQRSTGAASCRPVRRPRPRRPPQVQAPCRRWGRCPDPPGGFPDASGRCRWCLQAPAATVWRFVAEIPLGIRGELAAAAGTAEEIVAAAVARGGAGFRRIDFHAADRIGRKRCIAVRMRRMIHRQFPLKPVPGRGI